MTDIVVYGNPVSPFVRKVEVVLASLARHTLAMKERTGFAENLAACREVPGRLIPEPLDLS